MHRNGSDCTGRAVREHPLPHVDAGVHEQRLHAVSPEGKAAAAVCSTSGEIGVKLRASTAT